MELPSWNTSFPLTFPCPSLLLKEVAIPGLERMISCPNLLVELACFSVPQPFFLHLQLQLQAMGAHIGVGIQKVVSHSNLLG